MISSNITLNLFVRFVLFCLLQVLILDEIVLQNYISPVFYFAFIILLPFKFNNLLLLLLSFLLGISVDIFHSSFGLNASACVAAAFGRTILTKLMAPNSGFEEGIEPTVGKMGLMPFILYAGILSMVFHLVYQFVELFSFQKLLSTLLKVVISTVFSIVLILLHQIIFGRK